MSQSWGWKTVPSLSDASSPTLRQYLEISRFSESSIRERRSLAPLQRRGRSPRPTIGRKSRHTTLYGTATRNPLGITGIQRISPPRTGQMIAQTALRVNLSTRPKGMSSVPHPPFRDPLPKLHVHRRNLLSLRYTTAAEKSDKRSANSATAGQSTRTSAPLGD